ncbi:phage terminase small subunit-related protein [Bacillus tequilensis]|nr:phage terminase small subunit-related protein [Bacillus tequilensis]
MSVKAQLNVICSTIRKWKANGKWEEK